MAQPLAPDDGPPFLRPPALEDGAPAGHPARFIREFTDQPNRGALGFALPTAAEGRPVADGGILLRSLGAATRHQRSSVWRPGGQFAPVRRAG